ncbi:hypothetical protein RRG08_024388 [Elysia crispata]|uniref:Uncharacterized protein n=1 Tax=Elysia crispata TaxID=231223 RepID=A0AAE1DJ50_9GAST|nr:hypothetical protein RRG08_024388 [Elysia crispata]
MLKISDEYFEEDLTWQAEKPNRVRTYLLSSKRPTLCLIECFVLFPAVNRIIDRGNFGLLQSAMSQQRQTRSLDISTLTARPNIFLPMRTTSQL